MRSTLRRAVLLLPLLALVPVDAQGEAAPPVGPLGGWFSLRLGDTKEEALAELAHLPHGPIQMIDPGSPPFETDPEPDDIRTEHAGATFSQGIVTGIQGLDRHLVDDDHKPSIHLTFFRNRLVTILVMDWFEVGPAPRAADTARAATYAMKNHFGAALPNMTFQDLSRPPSYAEEDGKRVLVDATTKLHCAYDNGTMDVSASYLNISSPLYGVSLTFTSRDGQALNERQKKYAAAQTAKTAAYEAARDAEFEVEITPKMSIDEPRIQLRTTFDAHYKVNCTRSQPPRYKCVWSSINSKTNERKSEPTLSGIYTFNGESYEQFVMTKKIDPPTGDADSVKVIFHRDIWSGLGKSKETYTGVVRFTASGRPTIQLWFEGVTTRPMKG